MKITHKRGNVIATALIVTALLIATGIMLQRELYPPQRSDLHKTMSAFEQNVYSTPDQLLQEYAMNGYQNGTDNFWFCVNRPSPPNLSRTKDDFTSFVTNDLVTRLETLTKEYPEFNITIGSPVFQLEAPQLIEDLDPNVTVINITNLTITVRDGDRLIQKSLSQEQAYRMHFWLLYKGMQGWTKCGSADIYTAFEQTFLSKSCAFFKDTCICAPGEDKFCCHGPQMKDEKCDGSNPKRLQDFAPSERDSLIAADGVTVDDVQAAADLMAGDITGAFNGQERNWCGQTVNISPTGIKCSARIENPQLRNDFFSSYAFHNTNCLFQCPQSCGIVSISAYDSFLCSGDFIKGPSCYIPELKFGGCGGTIAAALANPAKQGEYLSQIAKAAAATCTRDNNGIVHCGSNTVTGDPNYNPMSSCKLDPLRSSAGQDGPWAESTATALCNPTPSDAQGTPPGVGDSSYAVGDQKIKCLSNPADYSQGRDGIWFGTNGWIDKKGDADIIITCQDPGTGNVKPIQAEMRMRVSFRHACRQPQRLRALAPPACKAPGASGDKTCGDIDCNNNPCFLQGCKMQDDPANPGKKIPVCVPQPPDKQPDTCPDTGSPDASCHEGACVGDKSDPLRKCDLSSPTPISDGMPCGTTPSCNACNGGKCQPTNEGVTCIPNTPSPCNTGQCGSGKCNPMPDPAGTCYGGTCGSCVCNNGVPDVSIDASKCSGSTTIPTDCVPADDTKVNDECKSSGINRFDCVPGSGPTPFDRSKCCPPGGGAASQVCASGTVCCGTACLSSCSGS